jgi:signal transduction histidine kinase
MHKDDVESNSIRISKYISNEIASKYNNIGSININNLAYEVEKIARDFNLYKINVFSPEGVIIFSTNRSEIGRKNEHPYFYEKVLKGEIYTRIAKKNSASLDGNIIPVDVIETYVPVFRKGKPFMVLETYDDISVKKFKLQNIILDISIIVGILSFILLVAISISSYKARQSIEERDRAEDALKKHQSNLENEIKERTAELVEINKHLLKMESIRRDFIANISHEIKTPLTSIIGFIETLEDGALNDRETTEKFLKIIKKNSNMIAKLTDDLLKLSELEHGAMMLYRSRFNIRQLIDEVISGLARMAEEKGLAIELTDDSKDYEISADRLKLKEVIYNLLDNAIKYSKEKGRITISVSGNQEEIQVEIKDDGIGISEENIDRVFERFFRADKSRSRRIGGTGLGLPIVKQIIELHGGSINIESKLNVGTKVVFSIPKKNEGA